MRQQNIRNVAAILVSFFALVSGALANDGPYAFNVLNQRSIALTSQYWNPILTHVSRKSGVPLELKMAKSPGEADALTEQGAYHFIYNNHFFTPERAKFGFRVIARPASPGIRGQIVVPADSAITSLQDLNEKEVAFASPDSFASYKLPLDALVKAKVRVKPVFTTNQEAGFAQLKVGTVAAAGVNNRVIEHYGRREGFAYRLLWNSEIYNDLPIMASPKVPAAKVAAVREAFVNMAKDPEGRKVLEAGAELLKIKDGLGFVAATDRDYDNYRAFFRQAQVK